MKKLLTILLLFTASLAQAQSNDGQRLFFALLSAPGINSPYAFDYIKRWEAAAGTPMPTSAQIAFDNFCTGLDKNGLVTAAFTQGDIWPSYGTTDATAAVSLFGRFPLTFIGAPSHTSAGTVWNGTTQYANTGLVPSTHLTPASNHIAYYTNSEVMAGRTDMGCFNVATTQFRLISRWSDGTLTAANFSSVGAFTVSSSLGFSMRSRVPAAEAAQNTTMYRNGAVLQQVQQPDPAAGSTITVPLYLGANNSNGTVAQFSNRTMCLASAGGGMTPAQAQTYSALVNQLMTDLGRNTY